MDVMRRVTGATRPEHAAYIRALRETREANDLAAGRAPAAPQKPLTDRERNAIQVHAHRRFISLQKKPGGEPSERTLEEELRVGPEEDVEERLDETRTQRWLRAKLANGVLTDRERAVLYGVLTERTFTEIGADLKVSRQRAQMIYTTSIDKLRQAAFRDAEETGRWFGFDV
jgi:DNA-directed RNA polymerase sigma subunit (sigma70/sigma32)